MEAGLYLWGIPTKGARADSIASVEDIAVQSQALLNVKDLKKDERKRTVVGRFMLEEPQIEQIQDVVNDIMRFFREDLHRF